jgi:protein-disulfide isomerase
VSELGSAPVPEPSDADHRRGSGPLMIVYADFECPYCAALELRLRVLALTVVFRHFPVRSSHPRAWPAACAAEAAGRQGRFWEMHDLLLDHQDALEVKDLIRYAEQLGLDVPRFRDELRRRVHAARVAEDVADADASQVTGTPTFFIDGRRHHGAYDVATLKAQIMAARRRNLARGTMAAPA